MESDESLVEKCEAICEIIENIDKFTINALHSNVSINASAAKVRVFFYIDCRQKQFCQHVYKAYSSLHYLYTDPNSGMNKLCAVERARLLENLHIINHIFVIV